MTELETQIRELFRDLAEQTMVTPNVHPGIDRRPREPERNRWAYIVAAAVTFALVAGVLTIQLNRDDGHRASPPDELEDPVGLFPAGNAERVVAISFGSPTDVAAAYLADRFPLGDDSEALTVRLQTPKYSMNGSHALLAFSFESTPQSGTSYGRLVAGRVEVHGDTGWAVIGASVGDGEMNQLALADGVLQGDLTGFDGQEPTLTVREAATDEPLTAAPEFGPNSVAFRIANVDGDQPVAVQAWNGPNDGPEADGVEFVELLVRPNEPTAAGGYTTLFELVGDFRPGPFDDDPVSAFIALGNDGRTVIHQGDGFTVSISGGSAVDHDLPETGEQYCVNIDGPASGYNLCAAPDEAEGSAVAPLWTFGKSATDDRALIVEVVPDTVASVTAASGRSLAIVNNVWFDLVGPGLHTYVLQSADGTRREIHTFGLIEIAATPTSIS